jgi:protein phosphatase
VDRIALISDIHGNLPALRAVLDDIARRGIGRIFCLGDLVGKGPDGAEAVDLCRRACEATVQGNWDAVVARGSDHPANAWHRHRLGPERLGWLGSLPGTIDFALSGRSVRLFHASQKSPFHRVRRSDALENHLSMFENTDFTGDATLPDTVGYGDIHVGFVTSYGRKTLFNAGSVGNPLDMPQACYAILEGTYGRREPAPWTINLVRVPYDIDAAIRDARLAEMPDLEAYAEELRTARYRGLAAAG